MSRLARKPLQIPEGITVSRVDNSLEITKGSDKTSYAIPDTITLTIEDNSILCKANVANKATAALLGTTQVNINNIFIGMNVGFTTELQLVGIGYGVVREGDELVLTLGKSHLDRYTIPEGINITLPDKNNIVIFGRNKHAVGDVADEIIRFRPPDAYKGKGIRDKKRRYVTKEVKKIMSLRSKRFVRARIKSSGKYSVRIFLSNKHTYAQIADTKGIIITAVSSKSPDIAKMNLKSGSNVEAATIVGKYLGEKIVSLGLQDKIAYDRSGRVYHGRVAAIANGARQVSGIAF